MRTTPPLSRGGTTKTGFARNKAELPSLQSTPNLRWAATTCSGWDCAAARYPGWWWWPLPPHRTACALPVPSSTTTAPVPYAIPHHAPFQWGEQDRSMSWCEQRTAAATLAYSFHNKARETYEWLANHQQMGKNYFHCYCYCYCWCHSREESTREESTRTKRQTDARTKRQKTPSCSSRGQAQNHRQGKQQTWRHLLVWIGAA